MKIIWHRWAAGSCVENSLSSFQKAVEIGVDYIENDIRTLRDGNHVIFHDAVVDRVTNGKGSIVDYTLAELQQLELVNGEKIMTLEEYLTWVAPLWMKTIFELKQSADPITVYRTISAILPYDRYIIWSFLHGKIHALKRHDESVITGILFEGSFDPILRYLQNSTADIIGVGRGSVDENLLYALKQSGKKSVFWTIDSEQDIAAAAQCEPWWVVSNYPERVKFYR
jgi:glycerophosphoryl diester phosphodiesterase